MKSDKRVDDLKRIILRDPAEKTLPGYFPGLVMDDDAERIGNKILELLNLAWISIDHKSRELGIESDDTRIINHTRLISRIAIALLDAHDILLVNACRISEAANKAEKERRRSK